MTIQSSKPSENAPGKIRDFTQGISGDLKWPNSAAVFDDGRVAVADGGNNRVCIFDHDGKALWEYGGLGFSHNKLREPIFVAVSPDQYLFISDWHNHRVLVFSPGLKFSHSLFHLGPIQPARGLRGKAYLLELFLKHLLTREVGASHYFTFEKMESKDPKGAQYSLPMFLRGLGYYLAHPFEAAEIFSNRSLSVRKVNGIAFAGGKIVISQKANRCVSSYLLEGEGYKNVKLECHVEGYPGGEKFGRLCNLVSSGDKIYVCDQNSWCIAILNTDLSFERNIEIKQRGKMPMGPFSCAVIDSKYLAVARSFGFEIIRISDGKMLWEDNSLGETHGITWDQARRFLYYVDRSNSKIVQYSIPAEL